MACEGEKSALQGRSPQVSRGAWQGAPEKRRDRKHSGWSAWSPLPCFCTYRLLSPRMRVSVLFFRLLRNMLANQLMGR